MAGHSEKRWNWVEMVVPLIVVPQGGEYLEKAECFGALLEMMEGSWMREKMLPAGQK